MQRLSRVLPLDKDRPALKMVLEGLPSAEDRDALLDLFEDEAALSEEQPTASQIEELYRNRWFRYFLVRLKVLHNSLMAEAFSAAASEFPEYKGKVRGVKMSLGLVGSILDEAKRRDPREEDDEVEANTGEFDDFGDQLAPGREKE